MGQIENPKLPELHDRMASGGYTILWEELSGCFVVWGDNGHIRDGFTTKEDATSSPAPRPNERTVHRTIPHRSLKPNPQAGYHSIPKAFI